LAAGALLLRARPFAPQRLTLAGTWWALATYAVVAAAEETLYRGFLQGRLEDWRIARARTGSIWPVLVLHALMNGLFVVSLTRAFVLGAGRFRR